MLVVYPKTKAENSLDTRFNMEAMANQIMIMVLSAVAEIEHGTTVDRLKEGKLVWADKGYSIGGKTPFGYKKLEERSNTATEPSVESSLLKTQQSRKYSLLSEN